jgi:hypothetical protein
MVQHLGRDRVQESQVDDKPTMAIVQVQIPYNAHQIPESSQCLQSPNSARANTKLDAAHFAGQNALGNEAEDTVPVPRTHRGAVGSAPPTIPPMSSAKLHLVLDGVQRW